MDTTPTTLTQAALIQLQAPFPAEAVFFLQGNAYLQEWAITDRIESIDPGWSFEITQSYYRDARAIAVGKLTILGSTRSNTGMGQVAYRKAELGNPHMEANDAEKSAATDCLKRAARLFGIGRYFLTLPPSVKDDTSYKRWLNGSTKKATAPKKKTDKPIEAVVVAHIAKDSQGNGNLIHKFKTRDDLRFSTFSRAPFIATGWIDDNEWSVAEVLQEELAIPVLIEPDGEFWRLVEVANHPDLVF